MTHLNKKTYSVDVFYRSTELLKKFAPDIVLIRDILLPPFDVTGMTCTGVNFHFANLTCHSMYLATLFPHLPDPIADFRRIMAGIVLLRLPRQIPPVTCALSRHNIAKFAQPCACRETQLYS